ncbi:hypothetical protein pb186bvf_020245 [Paramecium bursaria]
MNCEMSINQYLQNLGLYISDPKEKMLAYNQKKKLQLSEGNKSRSSSLEIESSNLLVRRKCSKFKE